MFESLTRQSLPSREYRELLGTALCAFSSNNGFIIENIMHTDEKYDWYELTDKESGRLKKDVANTISIVAGDKIESLFSEIVDMRNRIFHSYRITSKTGEQVLGTKELRSKGNKQFEITEEYLKTFIMKNSELSSMLNKYRKELREHNALFNQSKA